MRVLLDARRLRPGRSQPPVSKSDAIRALVLADLLELPRPFPSEGLPRDVQLVGRGMEALRLAQQTGQRAEIDCQDGGAPFRILLGQAAVSEHVSVFNGTPRLGERPHLPLVEALREALGPAGLQLKLGSPWPVEVRGVAGRGVRQFHVEAGQSGQYLSSLLLAAAALLLRDGEARRVEVRGHLASPGYVDLTLGWLAAAGFAWTREGQTLTLASHRRPVGLPEAPTDWSSAGYLLLLAWRSGGRVIGKGLAAAHPDRRVLGVLASLGLEVSASAGGDLAVTGRPSGGLDLSAGESPDLIPTLVALSAVLPARSVFSDLEILRGKESDRVAGLLALLTAAGIPATLERADRLVVTPGGAVPALIRFDSRGDHRLAMAAATLAICLGTQLDLDRAECVGKSFSSFFEQLVLGGAFSCYSEAAALSEGAHGGL